MKSRARGSTKALVVVAVVVALIAGACGSDKKESGGSTTTTATPQRVGLVFDLGGRGDKSFNDAAARGLDKAKSEFNVAIKELEPAAGGQNREELLRLLTTQKYPLNFAVGFLFADSVTAVATDNPDTMYAIVDSVIDKPNVASLTFAEEQGSYLVGAAAALKSKVHHIGFIGGVDTDLIKKFEAGYVAGAKKIDPSITIDIKYISEPPDFSGFNDTAKGNEIGLGMYNGGADVVYHAAGGSGTGLFAAAVAASKTSGAQKWAIGVDSDQYLTATAEQKTHILTSMMKRVDVAVYDTVQAYHDGTLKAGLKVFDLKADGVGYATSGGFVDDIKPQLEDLKAQIIDGSITVPTKP